MKRIIVACAAIGIGIGAVACAAAQAAPLCYWPAEIEADQAIRLQTELMLIGDTCQDPGYGSFLERNRDALVAYQQILIERFERERAGGSAEDALQSYMTRLANEAALRAGRTPSFCAEAADLVATVKGMQANGLLVYAATQAGAARQSYAPCGEPAAPIVPAIPVAYEAVAKAALVEPPPMAGTDESGLLAELADGPLARFLDPADRRQVRETTQRVLELIPSGQAIGWRNPFSRNAGTVVATRAYRDGGGRWCRRFEQSISAEGETGRGRGIACRRADSSVWDILP